MDMDHLDILILYSKVTLGKCTVTVLELIPDTLLVGAMPGDPAARCNVLYSEYDASGEAICQIILPPGSGPPTWPPSGHAQ